MRTDRRVLGDYVLESLASGGQTDRVRLVLRCTRRASTEEQPEDLELAVLSSQSWGALCIECGTGEVIRVACSGAKDIAPGECVRIRVRKTWHKGKTRFVSGDLDPPVLEVSKLGLDPLKLTALGTWIPDEDDALSGDDAPAWWRALVARGPRTSYELENTLLPAGIDDVDDDPICEAVALTDEGDVRSARRLMYGLLEKDLRSLDAHAHLGNFAFDKTPARALRHYAVGVAIGDQALGSDFDGVLLWSVIENRPFLRCLHGYGLTFWRLKRVREAQTVFERLLALSPEDELGVRFLLGDLERGRAWTP